jgi:hypothetical protein
MADEFYIGRKHWVSYGSERELALHRPTKPKTKLEAASSLHSIIPLTGFGKQGKAPNDRLHGTHYCGCCWAKVRFRRKATGEIHQPPERDHSRLASLDASLQEGILPKIRFNTMLLVVLALAK